MLHLTALTSLKHNIEELGKKGKYLKYSCLLAEQNHKELWNESITHG